MIKFFHSLRARIIISELFFLTFLGLGSYVTVAAAMPTLTGIVLMGISLKCLTTALQVSAGDPSA